VEGEVKLDAMETLYKKVGRKYIPVGTANRLHDYYDDFLKAGQWRMEYCPRDGRGRFWYRVSPDCASWSAAAMLAEDAMIEAINKAGTAKLHGGSIPLTKKQQDAVAKATEILKEVGLLRPLWWEHSSAYDIAQAGIDAVKEWR
jgi:hypothetical protein